MVFTNVKQLQSKIVVVVDVVELLVDVLVDVEDVVLVEVEDVDVELVEDVDVEDVEEDVDVVVEGV